MRVGAGDTRRWTLDLRVRSSAHGLAAALEFALLCLGALEIAGWTHNRLVLGKTRAELREERQTFAARLPGAQLAASADVTRAVVGNIPRELHPYFGYTARRRHGGANNHGFVEKVDYPYRAAPGELVVGLFGGSLAHQLAIDAVSRGRLEEAVRRASGAERVRLLSFASGGWRQPQTFYALSYYLDGLDVAIVLDGYNDVAQLSVDLAQSWPAHYPWRSVYAHFVGAAYSPPQLAELAKLLALARRAQRWTLWFDVPGLRESAFAHSLWRIRAGHLASALSARQEVLEALALEDDRAGSLATADESEARERIDDYFDLYARLSRWQALLARESGVAYAHFIQPNQYVRDSKFYSDRERREALRLGDAWIEHVTGHYARLASTVQSLRAAGHPVHDLRDVFASERETLYQDDCCHLNARGRQVLAGAMAERLVGSGTLATALRRQLATSGDPAPSASGSPPEAGPPRTASR